MYNFLMVSRMFLKKSFISEFTYIQGKIDNSMQVSNKEECLVFCKGDPTCTWFTYFPAAKECFLFSDCPTIDETCTECLSGEFSCASEDDVPKGKRKIDLS
jgi:hypothetical protein